MCRYASCARCSCLNRQWYYHHRRPSAQQEHDQSLCQALQELRKDFAGYGYRRMTKALKREGWKINHKRVERVMRQTGLNCRRKPRYVHTTDSHHGEPVYPNLIKELPIKALNQCWVADLTYVRLPEGFVYLACVLDAHSRKCLGWSLSRKMDTSLPLQALEMALRVRQLAPGLIHHSDRGRQYCSFAYVQRLQCVGAQISMSAPGQATENARAESFFKTVKYEEVYVHRYQTFEEAQEHLQTFLEDVYNAKRLHSSLDYVPPDEFEENSLKC
ncbi:MAG TPA: IS3 family transposase [Ktedonobacteraceae bacterium]|nr:IS3 family transposase [Ktedonobacteraceae bacterium]